MHSRDILENKKDVRLRKAVTKVFSFYTSENENLLFFFKAFSGGHSSSNPCAGDSGGGAFLRIDDDDESLALVGILSNSQNSCANEQGYSAIEAYRPWITDQIKTYRESLTDHLK